MTSLIVGPIFLSYQKYKEHKDGKRRIRNAARYEDLRREFEDENEVQDEERWRLDQQRMKTGFGIPEMHDDGRVRLSHDWEAERERELAEREMRERGARRSLYPDRTGLRGQQTGRNRDSWHGDYRTGTGHDQGWESGRSSPAPRRSLQVGRLGGREYESNESLSQSSSRLAPDRPRSDMSRSRDNVQNVQPQQVEAPRPARAREEEPQDMSSLFIDDILRERGLGR